VKRLAFALIVLSLIAARTTTVDAQGDIPELIEIDKAIDRILPKLLIFQQDYLTIRGKYFQALWSHSVAPADGALIDPDLGASKPTDQAEPFDVLWQFAKDGNGRVAMRLRVDIYDGPDGLGYQVTFETVIKGITWSRIINVGREDWREQPWIGLTPSDVLAMAGASK
jgi:hypothetical protein